MKPLYFSPLIYLLLLLAPASGNAAGSMLRVTCEGDDAGAEVQINGKFKGECPVDINIPEGTHKLRVVKTVDASNERIFEQDIRMGDGVVKKVEAVLTTRLTAAGQKREDDRLAAERAEAPKREARNRAEIDKALTTARQQGAEVLDGNTFRDCADCPEMAVVPPGSFDMGANDGRKGEKPVHGVTIGLSFALGKTEVTQAQWRAIMGNNPSSFAECGDNCPVEKVNWDDAHAFIQKLNAKTGKQYRLPSEAEWEYACRAGGRLEYCGSDNLDSVGWYGAYATPVGNSAKTTNKVGGKQPNAFGLSDMSGNVWEWVEDSYHDTYAGAPTNGSAWQGDGAKRVLRGGSWYFEPRFARAADRDGDRPALRDSFVGFRLARMLP